MLTHKRGHNFASADSSFCLEITQHARIANRLITKHAFFGRCLLYELKFEKKPQYGIIYGIWTGENERNGNFRKLGPGNGNKGWALEDAPPEGRDRQRDESACTRVKLKWNTVKYVTWRQQP